MKKIFTLVLFINALALYEVSGQCTNTVLDWDYRQFFGRNNGTIRTYISLAKSQNQPFTFGANKVTITHNYTADASIAGDNGTHTGSTGSYGNGDDVEFTGNGTITLTFQNSVTNLRFSMYDIDRNQRVTFGAMDGATARNISLTRLTATILTISNNNTTTARVDANGTTANNASTNGTVNVDIAGPVRTVTITVTNTSTNASETGQFWISDISGCSPGTFPNNYYAVSQPFTGMPSYVIAVLTDSVYYVNPTTGEAKFLFADIGPGNLNSVAYDPYNRFIYYTYSLSGSGGSINPNEKSLRRYDYNMDTFGVLVADITTIGIPTTEQGVESGAAAFYNGCLYLGVEGGSFECNSVIWRIEFNAAHQPIAVSQVYSQFAENSSGTRVHDWSDFGVTNGTLYDFDAGQQGSNVGKDFFVGNLLTGTVTQYAPVGTVVPRQVAIDWTGQVYNMGSPAATAKGTIAPYNGTDNIDVAQEDTMTFQGVEIIGSWGDAAEAFRPFCDFGDAPASYDPNPLSPAVNETDPNLHLGATTDIELNKGSSALADADGADEDGISTVTIFATNWTTYHVQVSAFNNTGANATLIGWLDWNGNGTFESGEASNTVTVTSSAVAQNFWLSWTGISSPLPNGSFTYLRVRFASASYGMNSTHATGWYTNGETEDYRVPVQDIVLPVNLMTFEAKAVNNSKVKLNWSASEETNFQGYEVQRSANGTDWEKVGFVSPLQNGNAVHEYQFVDNKPLSGKSRYRLELKEGNGASRYSEVRNVAFTGNTPSVTLSPNPATKQAFVSIQSNECCGTAYIQVRNANGDIIFYRKIIIASDNNAVELPVQAWPSGMYFVTVNINDQTTSKKLIVQR